MADQGLLRQSKPAGTTNTLLSGAPIDSSASAVLTIANDGTGAAYDVAIKNYDQKLVVNSASYLLHEGDVVTGYRFGLGTAIDSNSGLTPGSGITSADGEKTAKFESFYIPTFTEIDVKDISIRSITVESVSGTFAVGDTLTKGTSPDNTDALIYAVTGGESGTILHIGPSTINGGGTEFTDGDSVSTAGGASATVSTGGIGAANNEFVFSTDGSTFNMYLETALTTFTDRAYRFDVSDSTMTGRDLVFLQQLTVNGVQIILLELVMTAQSILQVKQQTEPLVLLVHGFSTTCRKTLTFPLNFISMMVGQELLQMQTMVVVTVFLH